MATGSRRGSSIWRMGASASNRLTEGLLSSSGKVAFVGLATAISTLAFAVWFGFELRYESELGTPMMRAAAVMNTSINQSVAALRGWVAYGDPNSLENRDRVWAEQIEPTLDRLTALSTGTQNEELVGDVAELRRGLRELKLVQWAIEDVARTPGNEPARVAYEMRLEPLRYSILRGLHAAIEQYSQPNAASRSIDFLAQLARFRSAFSEGDQALNALIEEFSEVKEHAVGQRLDRSRILAKELALDLSRELQGDLHTLVEFTLQEFAAYEMQVREVVALRRSEAWNVAQLIFARDAAPLVVETRTLASHMAEVQAARTMESSQGLSRASYAVIGMALLMGLLSGGSLLVSFRLKQQVHNVMARAKRLGQYELQEKIGKGGMGEVYLAHHAMLRRPTAVKLLRAENAQDVRAQSRFQQEVQLTCQLTHPNTIEIFDYGRTPEGIFYYAMEFLDGFTLEALVSLAGPVEPRRVVHTLLQACGSLQEAHDKDMLHRDIKPSNLMLTKRGGVYDTVKLLDFGLVKELTGDVSAERDERDIIVGTPMYLAPELILSGESSSPQSDLYALGAVGYFLLAGTTPFPAGEVNEILAHQLEDDPPFPSEMLGRALPQDLEYVIMSCLAKDPADRPASARMLAELMMACECGRWSDEDARLWWEEFGEAARNEVTMDDTRSSAVRTDIEVVVGDTRA
jgi:serine/threonine protein kinase